MSNFQAENLIQSNYDINIEPMSNSKLVLCLDDSFSYLELHEQYLETFSDKLSVATAADAQTALEMLESRDFDCIVSDFELLKTTGLDFYYQTRETGHELPFFLLTSRTDLDDRVAETNVRKVFCKNNIPEVYDNLLTAIEQAVEPQNEPTV